MIEISILLFFILFSLGFRVLTKIYGLKSGLIVFVHIFLLMGTLIFLCFVFYNKPFFLKYIELFILVIMSSYTTHYSVKFYRHGSDFKLGITKITKIILVLVPLISSFILVIPFNIVLIKPKNSPHIYFWSATSSLPRDDDTLNLCSDNDIGFVVVLREKYIDDGGANEIKRINYLLNHSVDYYICIGGDDAFFLSLDNADKFYDHLKMVRYWMIANNLYYNDYMKGFLVDAEVPKEIIEDLEEYSFLQRANYFVKNLPNNHDVRKAQETLEDFIKLVHEDEKDAGIIKLPSMHDEIDGDGDYSRIQRTIYGLDLDWDFSISMNYRTMHIPQFYDLLIEDLGKYDYTSDYQISYLEQTEVQRNIIPLSQFYYEVGIELYTSEVGLEDIEDKYIFIGTFDKKFKDTTYIANKEYKKDLDICRHFGVKKVFFYDWKGFKGRYGSDELKDLKNHLKRRTGWLLVLPNYVLNRDLMYSIFIAFIDYNMYLESGL